MAAKPKLTAEQWESAKRVWEADPRKGFPWLIEKLELPVSAEAVRLKAKQENWVKLGDETPNLENKKSKLGKSQTPSLDSKPNPVAKPTPDPSNEAPAWESVDESEYAAIGRPTYYLPSHDRLAYDMCLRGTTDAEMAEAFGVTEQTINNWKRKHSTFFESIRKGKLVADAVVAGSLYKKATGYRYLEIKIKEMADEFGNMTPVEKVVTEKELPPDTAAAFLWLKNRQPKYWRDKIEVESTHKLDPEMMARIKTEFVDRMAAARERQRKVLQARGLLAVETQDENQTEED
ncbi:hypothetical protein [Methylomonas sp. HYX-M1]|uniref:hypothetical protein n=1 Tax=Methylomonas sp. HYX-M1 TaxID=3139307 RepID=UPI00345C05DB